MPIPFRDADEIRRLGAAGFLRVLPAGPTGVWLAALFLVDARSEPLEFTYNRIEVPEPHLWRPDDLARHAARRLAASLFETCPRAPDLLLCLAGEVELGLFTRDLEVAIPTAYLAHAGTAAPATGNGDAEDHGELRLYWVGEPPPTGASSRGLLERLVERSLLAEPFDRAAAGLREVYGRPEGAGDAGLVAGTPSR